MNPRSVSVNGRSAEVTKNTRSERGMNSAVIVSCSRMIALVPGVSTMRISRSRSMGALMTSRLAWRTVCSGWSPCSSTVMTAVVGVTPSFISGWPMRALMNALLPALNSPTTTSRNSSSSCAMDWSSASCCSSAASIRASAVRSRISRARSSRRSASCLSERTRVSTGSLECTNQTKPRLRVTIPVQGRRSSVSATRYARTIASRSTSRGRVGSSVNRPENLRNESCLQARLFSAVHQEPQLMRLHLGDRGDGYGRYPPFLKAHIVARRHSRQLDAVGCDRDACRAQCSKRVVIRIGARPEDERIAKCIDVEVHHRAHRPLAVGLNELCRAEEPQLFHIEKDDPNPSVAPRL